MYVRARARARVCKFKPACLNTYRNCRQLISSHISVEQQPDCLDSSSQHHYLEEIMEKYKAKTHFSMFRESEARIRTDKTAHVPYCLCHVQESGHVHMEQNKASIPFCFYQNIHSYLAISLSPLIFNTDKIICYSITTDFFLITTMFVECGRRQCKL